MKFRNFGVNGKLPKTNTDPLLWIYFIKIEGERGRSNKDDRVTVGQAAETGAGDGEGSVEWSIDEQ